jgi:trigger factor
MQITITELAPCQLSIHYEADATEIKEKRDEVIQTFKKAPVKGFREGKASIEVIKIHYAKQINESLKRALAESSYHNTLFEKNLRVHGAPKFNSLLLDGGKFVTEFEVFTKPDFEVPNWKDMEIPKPHETHNANEVAEKMMDDLRHRMGDAVPFSDTDFIQTGDNIIVDYEGSVNGSKIDSLCAQAEMMTVGKSPLQGFDSNLLGMSMGETREFDFVAPEGGLPSISGKTIHFKVTLTTGAKTVPCGLDDDMAKRMGKADFKELHEFVSQSAFARVTSLSKMQVHDAVAKKLVADTQINVPSWMSLSEAQYLAQQAQLDWNVLSDTDREKFIQMAEGNVKLSLILDKVRENTPEAQLSDNEVFDIIKQNLAQTKVTESIDQVIEKMNKSGYLQILFSRIRDEQTIDTIIKSVKLID